MMQYIPHAIVLVIIAIFSLRTNTLRKSLSDGDKVKVFDNSSKLGIVQIIPLVLFFTVYGMCISLEMSPAMMVSIWGFIILISIVLVISLRITWRELSNSGIPSNFLDHIKKFSVVQGALLLAAIMWTTYFTR